MAEKCRFSECSMHMCHGERCRGCCNSTDNKNEIVFPAITIEKRGDIYASLKETIKTCSDEELIKFQQLLQAEIQKRRGIKLKRYARRRSVRGQKPEEQVYIELDNDGKPKRKRIIKKLKPKPPYDDKS